MNSKDKGDLTEAMVLAALVKSGKTVLIPWGDNARFDLVLEEDGKFSRVQCKTAQFKEDKIVFWTCSSETHRKNGMKKGYKGEVEFFGVYCKELDKSYLVPVDEVPERSATLRLTEPQNNRKDFRWAKDYEL